MSPLGDQIAYALGQGRHVPHLIVAQSNTGRLASAHRRKRGRPRPGLGKTTAIRCCSRGIGRRRCGSIWKVPTGGNATAPNHDGDAAQPAVSPDGTRLLAFVREVAPSGETRVFVGPRNDLVEGSTDHVQRPGPLRAPPPRLVARRKPVVLPGAARPVGGLRRRRQDDPHHDRQRVGHHPVWSSDGKSIYYTSSREGTTALWRVAASSGGTPMRVTIGTSLDRQPSISRDGGTLAWSAGPANLDIILHDTSQGREESFGTAVQELMPRLFPLAQARGVRVWPDHRSERPLGAAARRGSRQWRSPATHIP